MAISGELKPRLVSELPLVGLSVGVLCVLSVMLPATVVHAVNSSLAGARIWLDLGIKIEFVFTLGLSCALLYETARFRFYERSLEAIALLTGTSVALMVLGLFQLDAGYPLLGFFLALNLFWSAATLTLVASPRIWLLLTMPSAAVGMAVLIFRGTLVFQVIALVVFASLTMQAYSLHRANGLLRSALKEKSANRLLIEELRAARQTAETSLAAAQQANHSKTRFLAAASHDLRQPLTALSLFSESLMHTARGVSTRDLALNIESSVNSLEKLFDSLLDLSKLDAGTVPVNKRLFSVQDLLNRLREEYSEQAHAKSLQLLALGDDEWIDNDPHLLERVVRNLLENALRYTKTGRIELRCKRVEEQLIIEVADTGPGIPASEQERIFDEYYQISNSNRDRRNGLGIGLSIVRKLGQLMGVEVSLESEQSRGSCFRLIAQAATRPQMTRVEAKRTYFTKEGSLTNKVVLIIDDEPEIRDALAMVIKLEGGSPIVVETRAAAFSACEQLIPDVVVADFRLGAGENGVDVLKALQNSYPALKGLILTGDTGPEPLRQVLASGYRILHKPIQAAELITHLRAMIGLMATVSTQKAVEQKRAIYKLK